MRNDVFTIEFDRENGTIRSLVLNDDPDRMNWVEGLFEWGQPVGPAKGHFAGVNWGNRVNFEFTGMTLGEREARSRYRHETLELEVVRTLAPDRLTEKFIYRNTGSCDLFFPRGSLGVYTTFNDSYEESSVCMRQRCHAYIWCGGGHSYVHARKMGPYPVDVALVLMQGSLDCYSIERIEEEQSNDRGDFVLHPSPCHLLPGEEMVLEWALITFPHDRFPEAILSVKNGLWAEFEQETVFPGETFRITVTSNQLNGPVFVRCKGCELPYVKSGNHLTVEYPVRELGEHRFDFRIGEKEFHVFGFSSPAFDELIEKRVRFILKHQQMLNPASPLYGAFLIYDNEEQAPYYSYEWRDCNANRERVHMGLLVCRWAQMHPEDTEAHRAVDLFEHFLLREIYDDETGIVHADIGKHSNRIRLYDSAVLINFWLELYRLKHDVIYLKRAGRAIRSFYSDEKGFHFYPNGTLFSDAVDMIREGGLVREADELTELVRRHVKEIRAAGLNLPFHEVRFEQTIVTPAVAIPAAFYDRMEQDPGILRDIAPLVDVLCRFSGDQPDYRLNEIPIRHWDEYWFGKRHLYGDTLPHYHSGLTARSFFFYSRISRDDAWRKKAAKCLRNCLCLFFPDGRASCACFYPFSVTMRHRDGSISSPAQRGEFFDPFANDQDGVLYNILLLGGAEALRG